MANETEAKEVVVEVVEKATETKATEAKAEPKAEPKAEKMSLWKKVGIGIIIGMVGLLSTICGILKFKKVF